METLAKAKEIRKAKYFWRMIENLENAGGGAELKYVYDEESFKALRAIENETILCDIDGVIRNVAELIVEFFNLEDESQLLSVEAGRWKNLKKTNILENAQSYKTMVRFIKYLYHSKNNIIFASDQGGETHRIDTIKWLYKTIGPDVDYDVFLGSNRNAIDAKIIIDDSLLTLQKHFGSWLQGNENYYVLIERPWNRQLIKDFLVAKVHKKSSFYEMKLIVLNYESEEYDTRGADKKDDVFDVECREVFNSRRLNNKEKI